MNQIISQRSMVVALPLLSGAAAASLFFPWISTGVGSLDVSFTPISSDMASAGAWFLVLILTIATPIGLFRPWALAPVGWAAATISGFSLACWLLVQRVGSVFSIRIVKTEFGSVLQPALVVSILASLLVVAVIIFDSLGDISSSPLLKTSGGARTVIALLGSVAILVSRDLPFVYARIGSATWAIGGGAIPALGEVLGISGIACVTALILGLFVSHVALERVAVISAAVFGLSSLLAVALDSVIIAIITSFLGGISGRPDGRAVVEGAFGPWVCVAVAILVILGTVLIQESDRFDVDESTDVARTESAKAPTI